MQHLLHQIKAKQFYTDLGLYQRCLVLQKIEFKDFSRLLSDFPVLFNTDLIFKDFSRKPSKSNYFSSLCEPCVWMHRLIYTLIVHKQQNLVAHVTRSYHAEKRGGRGIGGRKSV